MNLRILRLNSYVQFTDTASLVCSETIDYLPHLESQRKKLQRGSLNIRLKATFAAACQAVDLGSLLKGPDLDIECSKNPFYCPHLANNRHKKRANILAFSIGQLNTQENCLRNLKLKGFFYFNRKFSRLAFGRVKSSTTG